MTDAPKHIWAGVLTDEYRGMTGTQIRVWGDDPRVGTDDQATEYTRTDLVAAMQAENQRLRAALDMVATYRAKCHAHDDDMGHLRRCFDVEAVMFMEAIARAALKGADT